MLSGQSKPKIALIFKIENFIRMPRGILLGDCSTVVGAAIVNANDFVVLVCLIEQAIQAASEILLDVVHRNDDRYFHAVTSSCFASSLPERICCKSHMPFKRRLR